jgi:hypothetical protein
MPNINQIYTIVNSVASQSMGSSTISAVDASSFIALGNSVLSSQANTDAYLNTLVDRIGKTIFSIRAYQAADRDIVREPFEFGCILQKIYVDMPEARVNNTWNIGNNNYTPEFAPVIKPTVKQKLFNAISTWEVAVTIPDEILKTAFTSETAMAVFIDAIFTAMENMMQLAMENNINITRAAFIARKLNTNSTCGAINLLANYNDLTGETLTVNTCLRDLGFLKYAAQQIKLWTDRMVKMSTLFNDETGYKRHTPKDLQVLDVLADFDTASTIYLQADTYHNELVKMPYYNVVPYWQGSGEGYTFDDTSSVNIKIDANTTVDESGILAVLFDHDAMGVTIKDRRATTERNNHDEYTNYYNKANIGYFNDMSENGIVFYIKDVSGGEG